MIPWNDLQALTIVRSVSDAELKVVSLAMNGDTTEAIAQKLRISPDAVRKRLGEVYKKFGIKGGGPGKLAKLQKILVEEYQNNQANVRGATRFISAEAKVVNKRDWGEAVNDVKVFYGRSQELAELKQWIVQEKCLLVGVLGIGGVGKTALSLELAEQLDAEFEYVVWRSLQNPPPAKNLLADLIYTLSNGQDVDLPANTEGRLSRLLDYLRQHRCLLILDNAETLLRRDELAGSYREGYEDYGELFKQIGTVKKGEDSHKSCLMITSREKPNEIALLERDDLRVRVLKLEGLDPENARKIISEKIISSGLENIEELIDRYRGNPLALKIAATTIQDLFNGNIEQFLDQGTTVFGDIRTLLANQFDRLSDIERSIMYWLAINRDWVSLADLRDDIVPVVPMPDLLEALESLWWRSLIEKNSGAFRQQPVVMEYVIERLIDKICKEIVSETLLLFNRYALIKAQSKDFVRSNQIRFILKPALDQLTTELGNVNQVEEKLRKILVKLQTEFISIPGYAGGNILNFFVQLKTDLSHYNFSKISIWQAYLSDVELHQVDFSGADLSKSVFADNLSSILAVAFSPNGKLLATGDANNSIHIQTVDGEQLFVCTGHSGWIRSICFSPAGEILVSSSDDRTVRLWDVQTGQCLKTLYGHTDIVRAVSFNPTDATIASGSDDRTIRVWDVNEGECLAVLKGHGGRVRTVSFSPDGQILASASSDRTIKLWDFRQEQCLKTIQAHRSKIWSIAFHPAGKILASGSTDHTIKLWDINTGECLKTLQEHHRAVLSVAFSWDGNIIASGSDDQTVKLWNLGDWESFKTLKDHTSRVWSVAFSPDRHTLATGSDDQTVRLWDGRSWQCLKTLQGYTRGVRAVAFNADGSALASGSEDRIVRIWNSATGDCSRTFHGHIGRVYSVSFSPDGQKLASASDDLTVKLWNVNTGGCTKTIQAHVDWIRSVVFSPDGQKLASGSDDTTIKLWDANTGEWIRTLEGHPSDPNGHRGWIWSIAFGLRGQILASASDDCTAKLWDVQTGRCLKTLEGHGRSVFAVAISPHDELIASGSEDQTIRLWDRETGTCLRVLEGHTRWIRSIAFSPDSQILASGGGDHTVRLWDVTTGDCLKVLFGHRARIRSIAFSPDGRFVASGSRDEAIRIWEVATGKCAAILKIERPYEGMNITGVNGLKDSYKATLIALGAADRIAQQC